MPLNKNAFIRYMAIDKRLRRYPMPTLIALKKSVESALSDTTVSLRTVQLDIQEMRYNQGLSFEAPIKTRKNKNTGEAIYYYSIEKWSLIKRMKIISDGISI